MKLKENENWYSVSVGLFNSYKMDMFILLLICVATSKEEAKGKLLTQIQENKEYKGYKLGNFLCDKIPKESEE